MAVIAYIHDGTSIYDSFFLDYLTQNNTVYLLTFNKHPKFTSRARIIEMNEPLSKRTSRIEWMEGVRMYAFAFLRTIMLTLNLRHLRPQIVFACMATKYGFYTALSMFRPFVLVVWGSDVLIAPKRFFLLRFLAKFSIARADAIILDSRVQEKAVIQLGGNPEKVLRFPWLDLSNVRPKATKEEIRAKLGWSKNLVVVCTRSHESIYGVHLLIEAIPGILRQVPESRFLFIGKGRLTQQLIERVKGLKVEDQVKFLGNIPHEDVFSYVNAADLNVSPSFSDGTSASLLEAMALGIPSVTTEISGNKEWIDDGQDGRFVPVKDSKKLAETIISLLNDETARKEMGMRASKKVRTMADWQKNSQALSSLILRLIQGTGQRES